MFPAVEFFLSAVALTAFGARADGAPRRARARALGDGAGRSSRLEPVRRPPLRGSAHWVGGGVGSWVSLVSSLLLSLQQA